MQVIIKKNKVPGCTEWLESHGILLRWDVTSDSGKMRPYYTETVVFWKPIIKSKVGEFEVVGIIYDFPHEREDIALLFKITFG